MLNESLITGLLSAGPDKFLSQTGTSRTGRQWAGSRADRRRARAGFGNQVTREASFYDALDRFLQSNHDELKNCGYERDIFGIILDQNYLEEYSQEVTFERQRFLDMVTPHRTIFS
jgi:hypothetical protein